MKSSKATSRKPWRKAGSRRKRGERWVPPLRLREESRDVRLVAWLDSLRADAIFGWRQLKKRKVTSAAAILSLALGIGACTSAFRLIDALLLRPLPVSDPEQLYALVRQATGPDGKPAVFDGWAYPDFALMRAAAKGQADLIAVSYSDRTDLTYGSDAEMEKAYRQYVSGWMFSDFGLRPAAGRLFIESDDLKPGAHPYAVLSYDYWTNRFGRDPKVIGRTFRIGNDLYEIIGVGPERFTGTEPGTVIDIFLPTMMHPGVLRPDWTWMRTIARVKPGVAMEPLRAKLDATSRAFEAERAKGFGEYVQGIHGRVPESEGRAGAGGGGRVRPPERLPHVACSSRRAGGAGAADRVRERRQPDGGTVIGASARDGAASLDWGGTRAPGATGAGGERLAGPARRRSGRGVRLVGGAGRGRHDQSARKPRAPVPPGRLAGGGVRPGSDRWGYVVVRPGAGAARLGR